MNLQVDETYTSCHICGTHGLIQIDGVSYCDNHLARALVYRDLYLYDSEQAGDTECADCSSQAVYCEDCGPSKCLDCGVTGEDAKCSTCQESICSSCETSGQEVLCYDCQESNTVYACNECGREDE